MNTRPLLPALLTLLALTGCGGGTGGGSGEETTLRHTLAARTTPIAPGDSDCPNGGIQVETGIDDNGNGQLDPDEVDSSEKVCNGSDGLDALVSITPEPAGANCPSGGQRIDSGQDANRDGTLDPDEIDHTRYVCHGQTGAAGNDGLDALITATPEPAGANCPHGGLRVDTGQDSNGNGQLDPDEVDQTGYVCDIVTAGWAPAAPELTLTPQAIKTFRFTWNDVSGETEYRLLEDPDGHSGYTLLATLPAGTTSTTHEVFLPARINARYILAACNDAGCNYSLPRYVSGTLAAAVGYAKAANAGAYDQFGQALALSADGTTLAVGAPGEDSNGSDPNDDSASAAGAVYVFRRDAQGNWSQEAYLKAANAGAYDQFGRALALSADGTTLAVGAPGEDSNGSDPNDDSASSAGAAYVFVRDAQGNWSQEAYLKAANAGAGDGFGRALTLSGDTLAVGAPWEDSNGSDPNDDSASAAGAVYVFVRSSSGDWLQFAYLKATNAGAGDEFGRALTLSGDTLAVGAPGEDSNGSDPNDGSAPAAGAAYVFVRDAQGNWSQEAYLKAPNTDPGDEFGWALALSADGTTLAVGAPGEDSNGSDPNDDSASAAGAAYVFGRDAQGNWSQEAYLKAPNTDPGDEFGWALALSADGTTLAVGAPGEDSAATGLGGDQLDDSAPAAGAAYVFTRGPSGWAQPAYLKAPNTDPGDEFGWALALSADGTTLAVGAPWEDSNGSDPNDDSASTAGAVYLY